MIIYLTLVFMLIGCNSTTQNTNDSVDEVPAESTKRPDIKVPVVESFTKPLSQEEAIPTNWYIRLVAEDTSRALKTNSAQLGVLEESDAVVKHTLISHGHFSSPYLDIVFIDPDGVVAGTYKTNYHTYQEDVEERWRFTVQTDDNTSDIRLTWNGLYALTPYTDDKNREQYKEYRSLSNPLIKHMKLVDVETGKEIAVSNDGKVQTYVFNMNGQNEKVFEWVVQTDEVTLSVAFSNGEAKTFKWDMRIDELTNQAETNELVSLQAKNIVKNTAADKENISNKRAESFDLAKPPVFIKE